MSAEMFLFTLFLLVLTVASIVLQVYGLVLCFQKKWYIGVVALVVPFFAFIVGGAKWVFKKDLLN